MPSQHYGYSWPDAAGTPTDPTAAYAIDSVEMFFQTATKLFTAVEVAGAGADAIQARVSLGSIVTGTVVYGPVAEVSMINGAVGVHFFTFDVPDCAWVQMSFRRIGGTANTLISAWTEARALDSSQLGNDRQPPELMAGQQDGVILWDDGAGAADATGGAYALGPAVGGHWIPVGCATEWILRATLTGGPSTTIELMVEESPDMTIAGNAFQEVVSSISGATDRRQPGEIQINGANGSYLVHLQTRPGSYLRIWAKDTGASSDLIIRGYPYRVGA